MTLLADPLFCLLAILAVTALGHGKGFGEKVQAFKRVPEIVLQTGEYLRVCPKTSGGITKFSEHEAD